jgi:ribosomal protein S18 acetylase RimI-like enzyme
MNDESLFDFSCAQLACMPASATAAVAVRRATSEDLAAVTAIHTSAFRRMVRRRVGWSASAQDADVARTLLSAHSLCIVAALQPHIVVGHVLLERVVDLGGDDTGERGADEHAHELLLSRIMLARRWRNRGIGSAVLRHIIAVVHSRDFTLSLTVWRENRRARRLYHRLGFLLGDRDGHKIVMYLPSPSAAATTSCSTGVTASDDDEGDDDDDDDKDDDDDDDSSTNNAGD